MTKHITVLDRSTTWYWDGEEFVCEHDSYHYEYIPMWTQGGPDGELIETVVQVCDGCGTELREVYDDF